MATCAAYRVGQADETFEKKLVYSWATATKGYVRFPSGSLQICWGTYVDSAATGTVAFAAAYKQVPIVVTQGSKNNPNAGWVASLFPYAITVTGFTRTQATDASTMSYIAIGIYK